MQLFSKMKLCRTCCRGIDVTEKNCLGKEKMLEIARILEISVQGKIEEIHEYN